MNLMLSSQSERILLARALAEKELRESRRRCESSLTEFIRQAWHVLEPGNPYIHGWHIDLIAAHLEAITDGVEIDGAAYNRLLVNCPPGAMKSMLVSVMWPAWEWGPRNLPHMRYISASHSLDISIRDNMRCRKLIMSDWYQARWPHVNLTGDQNAKTKFENTAGGFRQAAAAGSITGARGDRVIIDDPHSVEGGASDAMRQSTVQWFLEAVPTRVNNPETSAIVVIMQRLHLDDVSGVILDGDLGYDNLMIPMRFDPSRAKPSMLGLEDPRTEPGELMFPERFPLEVVERDERVMGPFAVAGQFDQRPRPRGGGIIENDWWQVWTEASFPPFDFIVAAVDTAFTEKQENDPSAMTVWGIWSGGLTAQQAPTRALIGGRMESLDRAYTQDNPRAMLIYGWSERLQFHELVTKVHETMTTYKVDRLLVEDKAAGHSVVQELRRVFGYNDIIVQTVSPKGIDKVSRVYAVQHLFAEGLIYAPDRAWADMVINQVADFPKAKHDDLVDTMAYSLKFLRDTGMLKRGDEWATEQTNIMTHRGLPAGPLYPV